MLYRKKPVVIEAYQIPAPTDQTTREGPPHWFISAMCDRTVRALPEGGVLIKTLEGDMRGDVGDYVIQGVKGELYPCKPDIFAATYEPA